MDEIPLPEKNNLTLIENISVGGTFGSNQNRRILIGGITLALVIAGTSLGFILWAAETESSPLAGDWMQAVLGAAGNYGEAYDDAFCDGTYDGTSGSDAMTGCLISRSGTLNALVSEGGIQYAPAMR